MEAVAPAGQVQVRGRGSGHLLRAPQAQLRRPQRPGLRRTGPGSLLLSSGPERGGAGPPPPGPPPRLAGRAGRSSARSSSSSPRRPRFLFYLGWGTLGGAFLA